MNIRYALKFLPDIEGNLQERFLWYERKVIGLEDDFLQLFSTLLFKCRIN